ncbi:MAG: hypothetical protein WC421_10830 [Elusimicrobiales bacterium]
MIKYCFALIFAVCVNLPPEFMVRSEKTNWGLLFCSKTALLLIVIAPMLKVPVESANFGVLVPPSVKVWKAIGAPLAVTVTAESMVTSSVAVGTTPPLQFDATDHEPLPPIHLIDAALTSERKNAGKITAAAHLHAEKNQRLTLLLETQFSRDRIAQQLIIPVFIPPKTS